MTTKTKTQTKSQSKKERIERMQTAWDDVTDSDKLAGLFVPDAVARLRRELLDRLGPFTLDDYRFFLSYAGHELAQEITKGMVTVEEETFGEDEER